MRNSGWIGQLAGKIDGGDAEPDILPAAAAAIAIAIAISQALSLASESQFAGAMATAQRDWFCAKTATTCQSRLEFDALRCRKDGLLQAGRTLFLVVH